MTLSELLETLSWYSGRLYVDARSGRLRYTGAPPARGSPAAKALVTFGPELAWLVSSGRLCCFCTRMLADGDKIACVEHRAWLRRSEFVVLVAMSSASSRRRSSGSIGNTAAAGCTGGSPACRQKAYRRRRAGALETEPT